MITPGLPLASTKLQLAAAVETAMGSVVTLAKTPASGTGPMTGAACQETIGILAALAPSMPGFCSTASKPQMTRPSGFSVIAWPKAAVRPETEPAPSRVRTVQPAALAASSMPLVTPSTPPFFMSEASTTMVLPLAIFGPEDGPSHLSTLEAYLSTKVLASASESAWTELRPNASPATTAPVLINACNIEFLLGVIALPVFPPDFPMWPACRPTTNSIDGVSQALRSGAPVGTFATAPRFRCA